MKQTTLPGFDPAPPKPLKRRRREQVIDAVSLALRILDRLSTPSSAPASSAAEDPPDPPAATPHKFELLKAESRRPPLRRPLVWHETIHSFMDEALEADPAETVGATVLYLAFCDWFRQKFPKRKPCSQRQFGQTVGKHLNKEKHGIYNYNGIKICGDFQQFLQNAKDSKLSDQYGSSNFNKLLQ